MIGSYIKEAIALQMNDLMYLKVQTDGFHIVVLLEGSYIFISSLYQKSIDFISEEKLLDIRTGMNCVQKMS